MSEQREEHATCGLRRIEGGRLRQLPETWGEPPGAPFSEERAAWVRANATRESVTDGIVHRQRRLTELNERRITWARLNYLDRIVENSSACCG